MDPRYRSYPNIEQLIQTVFYNQLALNVIEGEFSQDNIQEKIIAGMITIVQQIITQSKDSKSKGLLLSNIDITLDNCPEKYKPFLKILLILKNRELNLNDLTDSAYQIMELESFKENDPARFLLEPTKDVTTDLMRDTFYNVMLSLALDALQDGRLTPDDFDNSQIHTALPALTLLEAIQQSTQSDGIRLFDKKEVTINNCPQNKIFSEFTKQILSVKEPIKSLSEDQLKVVRHVLLSDDELPTKELEVLKTPELMKSVAVIKGTAMEISRQPYYKKKITEIIEICCEKPQIQDTNNMKPF